MTLKQAQRFAASYDCTIERVKDHYEWWHNLNHSMIGVCNTIIEACTEMLCEVILTKRLP